MKKYAFFTSALVCAALMAMPLSAELMKEPEGYIDEGKMPIMEDTLAYLEKAIASGHKDDDWTYITR